MKPTKWRLLTAREKSAPSTLASDLSGLVLVGSNGGRDRSANSSEALLNSQSSTNMNEQSNRLHSHSSSMGTDARSSESRLQNDEPGYGGASSSYHVAQAFDSCVKVLATSVAPSFALPWVRGEESHSTASGFAVQLPSGERRLLVHAGVLENHTLVQVRRASYPQKYVANGRP